MGRGIEHWLIGLAGRKGSGKDTSISSFNGDICRHLKFAQRLKDFTSRVFQVTPSSIEDRKSRETAFDSPVLMDGLVERMRTDFRLDVKPRGLVANNLREFMQFLGTEYVRGVDPDFWVNDLINTYWSYQSHDPKLTFITDCRFENEANAIRRAGGIVIRIDRLSLGPPTDMHPSEAIAFDPDFVIVNWHDRPDKLQRQLLTIIGGLAS